MAELSFEQKLDKITAKIVDIKMDDTNKRGVVSVEITSGKNKWYKPFGISTEQGVIKWEDFCPIFFYPFSTRLVAQLQKAVKKDMEKDIALKEVTNMKDKVFNLFN